MTPSDFGFLDYTKVTKESHVIGPLGEKVPVVVRGTYCASINSLTCVFPEFLHIPLLQMPLILVRQFRLLCQDCSFIANNTGCYLTFPDFVIEVDDSVGCIVEFTLALTVAHFDFDGHIVAAVSNFDPVSTYLRHANKVTSTGYNLTQRRTQGFQSSNLIGAARRSDPFPPVRDQDDRPRIHPCETFESHFGSSKRRITRSQLHTYMGGAS